MIKLPSKGSHLQISLYWLRYDWEAKAPTYELGGGTPKKHTIHNMVSVFSRGAAGQGTHRGQSRDGGSKDHKVEGGSSRKLETEAGSPTSGLLPRHPTLFFTMGLRNVPIHLWFQATSCIFSMGPLSSPSLV